MESRVKMVNGTSSRRNLNMLTEASLSVNTVRVLVENSKDTTPVNAGFTKESSKLRND